MGIGVSPSVIESEIALRVIWRICKASTLLLMYLAMLFTSSMVGMDERGERGRRSKREDERERRKGSDR